ncbi:hypothetical protein E2C01_067620 [Portunus trituberculatus]|uniref:Uncharacterized protein n=1 Tax=Portunus trituberculatus TaxID=210409 RepID=A0A5B7HVJ5_PORTR|nr:hypothetical protein [Portunus trituberculatus]
MPLTTQSYPLQRSTPLQQTHYSRQGANHHADLGPAASTRSLVFWMPWWLQGGGVEGAAVIECQLLGLLGAKLTRP